MRAAPLDQRFCVTEDPIEMLMGSNLLPLFVAQSHQWVHAACPQRGNARSRKRDQK
jgi:hypothetical protein